MLVSPSLTITHFHNLLSTTFTFCPALMFRTRRYILHCCKRTAKKGEILRVYLSWERANCASYYMIDVDGKSVVNTTNTSFIYDVKRAGSNSFTVFGINYFGDRFTNKTYTINLNSK